MRTRIITTALALATAITASAALGDNQPVGTMFTYQGRLLESGEPPTEPVDFAFRLYNAPTGGSMLGELLANGFSVDEDGLFTIDLDFGDVFSGEPRWLEVEIGSVILEPRQPLMPAPHAIVATTAANVPTKAIVGTYSGITGVGTLDELNVAGNIELNGWLGNTSSTTLEFRANNLPALRLMPTSDGIHFAPNIVAGASSNSIIASHGATIAGGGSNSTPHSLTGAEYATISGGRANTGSAFGVTIAGGSNNLASGSSAVIGGGLSNTASGDRSVISGGIFHLAEGSHSTIAGGQSNEATGSRAVIGGGQSNQAGGDHATVAGGQDNLASGSFSTVGGGHDNIASTTTSTVAGGSRNEAIGFRSTVGGGRDNIASGDHSIVAGGLQNEASGTRSTVGGGRFNEAMHLKSTVGGGYQNIADGRYATVPGGRGNHAAADYTFAAGRNARAIHRGAIVFSDSVSTAFLSTDEDQFLINAAGGVGIGTNDPNGQLHAHESDDSAMDLVVSGNRSGTNGHVARLRLDAPASPGAANQKNFMMINQNPPSAGGANRLIIRASDDVGSGGANVMVLTHDGNVGIGRTPTRTLDVEGTTRTNVLEIAGADLAEEFPFSEAAGPGMVVEIDPDNPGQLRLASSAYSRRVAGIVAGANDFSTGVVLGQGTGNEFAAPVALSGRVYVFVDATERAVEVGDMLTTSDRPGYAMAVRDHSRMHGAVIGKAMTALPEGEVGAVLVLVNLQ